MQSIVTWMKTFLILYFFLTLLLYLVPKDTYRKYLKFAVKMILLVALFLPILNRLSKEEDFFGLVGELENLQQEQDSKIDVESMEKMQNEYIEKRSGYYEEHFGEQESSVSDRLSGDSAFRDSDTDGQE